MAAEEPHYETLCTVIQGDDPGWQAFSQRTLHNIPLRIMQSIFSPAARRDTLRGIWEADRRGGELKMDWTKPLDDVRPMGVEWLADSRTRKVSSPAAED